MVNAYTIETIHSHGQFFSLLWKTSEHAEIVMRWADERTQSCVKKTSSAALEQRRLSSGALQSHRGSTFLQSSSFQMERVKGNGSKSARQKVENVSFSPRSFFSDLADKGETSHRSSLFMKAANTRRDMFYWWGAKNNGVWDFFCDFEAVRGEKRGRK